MSVFNGLFSSESVAPGHPDKICDRISDAVLDAFLRLDPDARVACETMAADNKIVVAGEFSTALEQHFCLVRDQADTIVRQALQDIGYGDASCDIDPETCEIEVRFNHQSAEIRKGVDGGAVLGAGDQGLMFGHAVTETESFMPLAWSLATDLVKKASTHVGGASSCLRPDGKAQVTVRYREGRPVGVETVVLSWQHSLASPLEEVRGLLQSDVIDMVIPESLRTDGFRVLINPSGSFRTGGPKGDTGLTGRKIIVDTYGGACPHGGGAFSGKDASKVDRSAAYAARHVALNIVAAGLAQRCTVQLAYAIGVSQPVSVNVDTHGTGQVSDDRLSAVTTSIWDLSPAGIVSQFELRRPIYTGTSAFGHFGRWRDPDIYCWERTDKTADLISAIKALA
jgi:S-adenosylmethionine synthetase